MSSPVVAHLHTGIAPFTTVVYVNLDTVIKVDAPAVIGGPNNFHMMDGSTLALVERYSDLAGFNEPE